jgi:hypothetical protein
VSNADAMGGLYLGDGWDALDIALAIHQSTPPSPYPWQLESALAERVAHPARDLHRSTLVRVPSVEGAHRFVEWDAEYEHFDAIRAGDPPSWFPRTIGESRELCRQDRAGSRDPQVDPWAVTDFFPYLLQMRLLHDDAYGSPAPAWSALEEYLTMARRAFIPRGWTSYVQFPGLGQTWGTVPGHPEPLRLPDDFEDAESHAWSLFDRPNP